jgi:hypothetical protein
VHLESAERFPVVANRAQMHARFGPRGVREHHRVCLTRSENWLTFFAHDALDRAHNCWSVRGFRCHRMDSCEKRKQKHMQRHFAAAFLIRSLIALLAVVSSCLATASKRFLSSADRRIVVTNVFLFAMLLTYNDGSAKSIVVWQRAARQRGARRRAATLGRERQCIPRKG